jgi:ATP-dependent 26S proteasome regulatory subunit
MWKHVLSWVASIAMAICMRMLRPMLLQEGGGGGEGDEHASKLKASNVERPTAPRMRDIGGLRRAKRELRECVLLPLRHPAHFYKGPSVLRPPRGVLLHGPPGTGKTLLAKAVAAEAKVPLLSLHAAALESKWYGEGPKTLQAAFSLAKGELSPCVIFFDEVDALGRARGDGDPACVYSLKCEMLRNLDEVRDCPVAVLACTNCPDKLDDALRRRMERSIHVGVPTEEERRSILRTLDPTLPEAVLERVASKTGGMTGARLASLLGEVHARRRRSRAFARALACTRDGHALLRALGPLTGEEWTNALRELPTRSS